MKILAMILPQQSNEDMDVNVLEEVAEEEELQVVTSVKQTGYQEEIMLKLSHHVTRECNPNPRLKLSHHVTRECNTNQAQAVPPCNQGMHPQSHAQAVPPCNQGIEPLVPPQA